MSLLSAGCLRAGTLEPSAGPGTLSCKYTPAKGMDVALSLGEGLALVESGCFKTQTRGKRGRT